MLAQSVVPVESRIDVPAQLPPHVETAVYFVVAEALTNVARYAQAENVVVDLSRVGDEVIVVVEDDGIGGADIETGTGLRGLVDRLSALDGTLELEIPEGGGTRLIARIPCGAGDLIPEPLDEVTR
jgi:signal transduction histidine kinase